MSDIREFIDSVKRFAEVGETAEERQQKSSMELASRMATVFAGDEWVAEMDELHPVGRRNFGKGRPYDPRSKSRFHRWMRDAHGVTLEARYVTRLLAAEEVRATYWAPGQINPACEKVLRPFTKLRKQGHGDRIPDIWARAVQMAADDSRTEPTAAHVKLAIAEYRSTWTSATKRKATTAERRSSAKTRIREAVRTGWDVSPRATGEALIEALMAEPRLAVAIQQSLNKRLPAEDDRPDLRVVSGE